MAATVEIVVGPARSGKTTHLLDRLRRYVAARTAPVRPLGGALWIAPTSRAVEETRNQILDASLRSCLGVSVVTFEQFADRLVHAASAEIRPISAMDRRRLLRRLIGVSLDRGELPHSAPIAQTDGYVDQVVEFITEMKRYEIWPDAFDEACLRGANATKDRELGRLYRLYQDVLLEHNLFDPEGRVWEARRLLQVGQRRPFDAIGIVLVDGFSDFTRTQHEILALHAANVDQLVIGLLAEHPDRAEAGGLAGDVSKGRARLPLSQNHPDASARQEPRPPLVASAGVMGKNSARAPARDDLFMKSSTTLTALRTRHADSKITRLAGNWFGWPALAFIERNLFRPPHREAQAPTAVLGKETPSAAVCRVRVLRTASDVGELAAVAGEIKRLLASDAARPDEVLVVARSLGGSAAMFREVFSEFGIPIWMEARQPLATTALFHQVHALLRLGQNDWPFRALLSIVTNRAFTWPDVVRVAAERVIRGLQVERGRRRLLDRVHRLAEAGLARAQPTTEGGENRPRAGAAELETESSADSLELDAAAALPLFDGLAEALDALPTTATPSAWAGQIEALVERVGLGRDATAAHDCGARINDAAWNGLKTALAAVERLATWLGTSPRLDAPAVLELLRDVGSHVMLPRAHDDVGFVRIVSAPSARAIRAPYVFVVGLTEGSFPQSQPDHRLYSDAERAALHQAGLPIETREERHSDEMLLFYEVITRAERQLTLSYPGVDDKGAPLSPCPFVGEMLRFCGNRVERVDLVQLGPISRHSEPASPGEFRVRAVADALSRGQDDKLGRLSQLLRLADVDDTAAGIDAGLRITAERATGNSFGAAEGVAASTATRTALARRFGESHTWSTTQLEQYADCPFQFYAERLLHLEPLGELTLETDYRRRGKLVHDALRAFHTRLRETGSERAISTEADANHFFEGLKAALESCALATPLWGIDAALQELDRRQAVEWANDYHRQHAEYDKCHAELEQPPLPAHFEVRFGPKRSTDDAPEDVLSRDGPFELDLGDEAIRIAGRVDRIDLGMAGGKAVFNLVDYKTGKAFEITDAVMENGTSLQLPLYAMAVENHLLAETGAVPWTADYWWIQGDGFGKRKNRKPPAVFQLYTLEGDVLVPTARWIQLRELVVAKVREIVHGIRDGGFPMHSADENCTGRCPFRTICRVAQVRSLEKQWPPRSSHHSPSDDAGATGDRRQETGDSNRRQGTGDRGQRRRQAK